MKKLDLKLPASWDEIAPDDVRFIFRRYEACCNGKISPLQLNTEIFCRLSGESFLRARIRGISSEEAEALYLRCENDLAFLFSTSGADAGVLPLSYDSVHNSLPVVRSGVARTLLTGPASGLTDLTFGEFRQASSALNEFFRSSDVKDLDTAIAYLYRRRSRQANRAGRRVMSPDAAHIDKAIRDAGTISSWEKTYIMMWFSACIRFLQSGKVTLNGEEVDLALMFSGGSGTDSRLSFTWNDLLVQMARDGAIGNSDRVDEEPLYSIIAIMWSNYKENKRNEKQSAKNKKA